LGKLDSIFGFFLRVVLAMCIIGFLLGLYISPENDIPDLITISSLGIAVVTALFLSLQYRQSNKKIRDSFLTILNLKIEDCASVIFLKCSQGIYDVSFILPIKVTNQNTRLIHDLSLTSYFFDSKYPQKMYSPTLYFNGDLIHQSEHSHIFHESNEGDFEKAVKFAMEKPDFHNLQMLLIDTVSSYELTIDIRYFDEINREYKVQAVFKIKVSRKENSFSANRISLKLFSEAKSFKVKIDGKPYINAALSVEKETKK
jgi:hypothetical protein